MLPRVAGVGLVVLLLVASIGAPPAGAVRGTTRGLASSTGGFRANATWGGTDVASAASPSSALATSFASPIDVHYRWRSSGGAGAAPPQYTVNDARLQIFYFGLPLATRDEIVTNPQSALNGTFDMSWDPGVLRWILEGTFGVTASLLAPNGTTVWSEPFFVHASAPYAVGAVLPILLLLIAIYEAYALAVSGRQARPPRSRAASGATKPPPSGPESEAGPTEPGTESP